MGEWLPLLRPGGIVALNDAFWWGVARAIRERLAPGGPLRSPRFAHNTLFFSYLPNVRWSREDGWELLRLRAGFLVGRLWGLLLVVIGVAPVLPWRFKGPVDWRHWPHVQTVFFLGLTCGEDVMPANRAVVARRQPRPCSPATWPAPEYRAGPRAVTAAARAAGPASRAGS